MKPETQKVTDVTYAQAKEYMGKIKHPDDVAEVVFVNDKGVVKVLKDKDS